MNATPLETALGASKPLPASNAEECRELLEVERLAKPHHRRVTISEVQRFHGWMETGRAVDTDADIADLLDELRTVERPKP